MAGGWHSARRLLGATAVVALVCAVLASDAMAQSDSRTVSVSADPDLSHAYFFLALCRSAQDSSRSPT